MKKVYSLLIFMLLLVTQFITGCKKTFEYSPYSADLTDEYDDMTTVKNLQKIQAQSPGETGRFKVAFISDTHFYDDELGEAIDKINADNEVSFVIVCGDLSDQGLAKEYMFFYTEIKRLNKPILTVIGNHDYLSNAEKVYAKMFGANNYTFDYKGYRFIFFDNVCWEKNATPDFDWLDQQAADANMRNLQPVLISHIPYFGDQYDSTCRKKHLDILRKDHIYFSVHGHQHTYSYTSVFDGDSKYNCLVVPSVSKHDYCNVWFDRELETPEVSTVFFQ